MIIITLNLSSLCVSPSLFITSCIFLSFTVFSRLVYTASLSFFKSKGVSESFVRRGKDLWGHRLK